LFACSVYGIDLIELQRPRIHKTTTSLGISKVCTIKRKRWMYVPIVRQHNRDCRVEVQCSQSVAFATELPPNPTEQDLIKQNWCQKMVAAQWLRKRKLEQFQNMEASRNGLILASV